MTLTEAKLTYPWPNVQLVAINPKNNEIFLFRRTSNKEHCLLSTEDPHVYYSELDVKIEKEDKNITKKALDTLTEMENWDWKPLRSLDLARDY